VRIRFSTGGFKLCFSKDHYFRASKDIGKRFFRGFISFFIVSSFKNTKKRNKSAPGCKEFYED
jgi:hypothetical protein